MRWEQPIQYATISDIGFRRRNNQDACVVRVSQEEEEWKRRGHLFVVADGMGGHAVGELASKIAVDTIPHTYFKSRSADDIPTALRAAIEEANATIYARGMQNHDFKRMGTTCVALVLSPVGAVSGHVGDSRLYRVRDGHVDQLTFDHSLQWELLREGRLKPEEIFLHESRHVITRSLGPENEVAVDIEGPFPVLSNDTYVLCSDGLTTHVSDAEIGVIAGELPVGPASRLLTHLANLRGGSDNITVVVANTGEIPSAVNRYYDAAESDKKERFPEANWSWLMASWAIAVAFAIGVSLILFEHDLPGLAFIVSSVVGLVMMSGKWFGRRKEYLRQNDFPESVHFTPYRTARFQLDLKFLNHLAAIEAELQRTAAEEDWKIDWQAHELAFTAAKKALNERRFKQALGHFAKVIDVLMAGVQVQRKLANRQAKWGKNGHANGTS